MKSAFILGAFLLVSAFGGHTASGAPSNWWKQLSEDLEQMKRELRKEQEQMKQELREERERMEVEGQKMRQEAEAERKRMNAELERIKLKCAAKGSTNGTDAIAENGRRVGLVMQETNGILDFFEQVVNPNTNKIEVRYYSIDLNDPKAEPTCGKRKQ